MLKIGLEKEFFLLGAEGKPVVTPEELPHDDCGLLVEARGQPFYSPEEAVYSLHAAVYKLDKMAVAKGLTITDTPIMKIDRNTRLVANHKFAKGLLQYENIYRFKDHRQNWGEKTAGVHISFTNERDMGRNEDKVPIRANIMFDWLQIFKKLDEAFATEIKTSKRNPGFYELKSDGRIEYRSLPANVDLNKVIETLKAIIRQ